MLNRRAGEIIDDFFNSIGHKQTSRRPQPMSALPPKADIKRQVAIQMWKDWRTI